MRIFKTYGKFLILIFPGNLTNFPEMYDSFLTLTLYQHFQQISVIFLFFFCHIEFDYEWKQRLKTEINIFNR